MKERYASNPVDKIAGFAALYQPSSTPIPIYDGAETEGEAWHRWLYTMESPVRKLTLADLNIVKANFFQQLLTTFPLPSSNHWFPSWHQVTQYPRFDEPDLEPCSCCIKPSPLTSGFSAFSESIESTRAFYGCLLRKEGGGYMVRQLTESGPAEEIPSFTLTSPTPDKILYDSGIEPQTQYILLDITPDFWMADPSSVIPGLEDSRIFIVCIVYKETQAGGDDGRFGQSREALYLKRVTTLRWWYGPQESYVSQPYPPLTPGHPSGAEKRVVRLK